MPTKNSDSAKKPSYAFLGPAGTFTELAVKQIKQAKGATQISVDHVSEAIDLVISGKVSRAVVPE